MPKREGRLPDSRSRTHQQSAWKASVQDVNAKLILAQIRPGDWFASVDLKDAYFHIRIAPHTQTVFLNSCQLSGRSTAFQYSVLPSGLLRPHALSKCINAALPPQIERKAHPLLSGRLADFSSVPGYAYQPHRLSVIHLESLRL